nr:MAG TPA: hypothetical protein [Bacteriophage sp.]
MKLVLSTLSLIWVYYHIKSIEKRDTSAEDAFKEAAITMIYLLAVITVIMIGKMM